MRARVAVGLLSVAVSVGASPNDAAARQGALVTALVDIAEADFRAGRLDEALRVLDGGAALVRRAEAAPGDLARLELQRAKSAYYQASLAGTPYDPAIGALQAALQRAQAAGGPALVAEAQDLLGLALYARGIGESAHDEARALLETALAARRKLADRRGESESLFHLGLTFENRKQPTAEHLKRAREYYEQALAVAKAGGFEIEASYAERHLAGQRQDAGDLDGALRGFQESLRLREASGYRIYVPPALMAVADVWKAKRDLGKARESYARALAEAERIGSARFREQARAALAELDAGAVR